MIQRPWTQTTIVQQTEVGTGMPIIQQKIGEGALGQVWRIVEKSGDEYALKKIKKKKLHEFFRVEDQKRQIDILRRVNSPHIVKFLGTSEDDKHVYIKMEYLKGINLRDFLLTENFMTVQESRRFGVQVFLQLLSPMSALRSLRVINRDIKPDNIIVLQGDNNSNVQIKMVDLGQARYATNINLTTKKGTYTHMAPQIYNSTNYDDSCDIWSLGVVLFQLFQGKLGIVEQKKDLNLPYRANRKGFDPIQYFNKDINDFLILSVTLTPEPIRYLMREMLRPKHQLRIKFLSILEFLSDNIQKLSDCLREQQIEKEKHKLFGLICKQKRIKKYIKQQKQIGTKIKLVYTEVFIPLKRGVQNSQKRNKDVWKLVIGFGHKIMDWITEIEQLFVDPTQQQQLGDMEQIFKLGIENYISYEEFRSLKNLVEQNATQQVFTIFPQQMASYIYHKYPQNYDRIMKVVQQYKL